LDRHNGKRLNLRRSRWVGEARRVGATVGQTANHLERSGLADGDRQEGTHAFVA
jgi:hypothetical protein